MRAWWYVAIAILILAVIGALVYLLLPYILASLPSKYPMSKLVSGKSALATSKPILWMTYHSPDKIPKYVFDDIEKYAPEYELRLFDDAQCEEYICQYYTAPVIEKFKQFSGAHAADLFALWLCTWKEECTWM